ncbi:MAG: Gfo/Idh/MocA family oxidoreductase, partial [Candidatus Heimdallarchaeota archaeon]|nr:Gfo/Idh/MocA family oxidoreductase [Candidatus Heimdallarchaeota archaeon]
MIKFGMVGGGDGSWIGDVHRKAARFDNKANLIAGCFSRNADKNLSIATALALSRDRIYKTFTEMAEQEGSRKDKVDFVSIVTPNDSHFTIARAFLENGIHVMCDKPVTTTSAQAKELKNIAEKRNLLFCVSYAYSGYPLITQAKELIKNNEIGKILFVNAEFPEEWMVSPIEREGNKQAYWRNNPAQSGSSNCCGDLGSHVEHLVSYITGLRIESLCASLDIMVEGRTLDDNASVMLKYEGGARGLYWTSYIAVGHDNGLQVRIYGTKGSLNWVQKNPNYLKVSYLDKPTQIFSRGRDEIITQKLYQSRIPAGHPEGFHEAFANIYLRFLEALEKKNACLS